MLFFLCLLHIDPGVQLLKTYIVLHFEEKVRKQSFWGDWISAQELRNQNPIVPFPTTTQHNKPQDLSKCKSKIRIFRFFLADPRPVF